MPRAAIVDKLVQGFQRRFGGEFGEVSEAEHHRAEELIATRYGTQEWKYELP